MDSTNKVDLEEDDIGRLLRAAGPREQLPDGLKQQWETHFRSELNVVQSHHRQQRRGVVAGIAAALVIAVGTVIFLMQAPAPYTPSVTVTASDGSSVITAPDGSSQALGYGQSVERDNTIVTGSDGHIGLAYGGYDLRINNNTRLEIREDSLFLREGEIYVSDDERRIGQFQLYIDTPQGRIRDIGTQFLVMVRPGNTVATVRKGMIELDTGSAEIRARAEPGAGRRVTLDRDRQVTKEQVATNGGEWQWIYDAAPAYSLDGQSAWEFLHWSVDQSGLELAFTSTATEVYARTTTLHGSIEGMDPEESVGPVLATTDLSAVARGGKLVVSLQQ